MLNMETLCQLQSTDDAAMGDHRWEIPPDSSRNRVALETADHRMHRAAAPTCRGTV